MAQQERQHGLLLRVPVNETMSMSGECESGAPTASPVP